MPSLKALRGRIKSVQSTKKITSAMKMIAAAKLRKAQERAQSARPYAVYMAQILADLSSTQKDSKNAPTLLMGNGKDQKQLIVVSTSNRGLCGGFNSTIVRKAKALAVSLKKEGKDVSFYCIGRKAFDQLRREYESSIIARKSAMTTPGYVDADLITQDLITRFHKGEFDVCTVVYNRFLSPLKQEVTAHRLIPFSQLEDDYDLFKMEGKASGALSQSLRSVYEYEPDQDEVLKALLPKNITVQMFRSLLENSASEHGARMAAMDGATRNANDMIKKLTLTFNRTRQAYITKELIEIISGAEAL